jgi:NAD(P)-dependent dehydrogenase (short-subunit alcohol dehydrogenase family)
MTDNYQARGDLDYAGNVVVVTGAGRGIGRAHALLLAARGARVVVNDLGGDGEDPAGEVVAEIEALGGQAVADRGDVASPDGAAALVAAALNAFGRVDAVVNNAGIVHSFAGLIEQSAEQLDAQLSVHVRGTFNVTRAAWPHLLERRAGRVVATASTRALFGATNGHGYAAAKSAVIGLMRCFAVEGEQHGLRANTVSPAAWTRMAAGAGTATSSALNDNNAGPHLVAPLVALLAHERCPCNGEVFTVGLGRFARIFVGVTEGIFDPGATPDTLIERFGEIVGEEGYATPLRYQDEMALFFRNLEGLSGVT